MAELQKKRAFEQLQELRHGIALLTREFSKAEKRYKKRTQESLRAAEENEGIIITAGKQWLSNVFFCYVSGFTAT